MMTFAPKVFLHSYGCQMNLSDGELVHGLLAEEGFNLTDRIGEADVILINTCSVRDHAEQRVLGRLRALGALKKRRPEIVIGVLGCMAQRLGEKFRTLVPSVDLVLGPDSYRRLPAILEEHFAGRNGHFIFAGGVPGETYEDIAPRRTEGVSAFVAIMRGCNNFCTYCIVPYVRGRERSRTPESIVAEISKAVSEGFSEVILLGQNVNSYSYGEVDFPGLLATVVQIAGLKRIRFLTSHPRDLSERLIEIMAQGGTICPSLHLPVQSGSDRILDLMGRGYSRRQYLEKVRRVREKVPDLMLTTDLLCGFPSESEEDFQETLDLMKEARFDDAFTFKYSVRPGTQAARMPDDVPEPVKIKRLTRMMALARQLADQSRVAMLGKEAEVLLEKPSPKDDAEWMERTADGRVALIPGRYRRGDIVKIKVEQIRGFSLWGRPYPKQN
jgi:tRNA-2-methylthio-N6-dimethylallyladenosine synthase